MRFTLPVALCCALIAPIQAVSAERPYYRNVTPSVGNAPPAAGSGGNGEPVKEDPVKVEPVADDQADKTGPLRMALSTGSEINLTYKSAIRAVFHTAGECQTRSITTSGVSSATLAGFGITAGRQGDDYVISGQLNRVGKGGYNLIVTVRGCNETPVTINAPINFNPDAPNAPDAPWQLSMDNTFAFSGKTFAFYPEIRNHGADEEQVDTSTFTYELKTTDPVNRPIPGWLSMPDTKTGVVSGQAPAAGDYGPYYVMASAPGGFSDVADFVVKVSNSFVFNGPNAVNLKANEQILDLVFTGTGGCGDVNRSFGIDSNTPLPRGMSQVYDAGRWVITGTPNAGGTWPVRFVYSDYLCAGSQVFPVSFTVTGAPEIPFAFSGTPNDVDAKLNGNRLGQYTAAYLDTTGPSWNSKTCEVVNAFDSSPANIPWAQAYPSRNYECIFTFEPTQAADLGTRSLRLKATTDTNKVAISDPFTLKVSPAAAAQPSP